jgi:hypothetical protein
MKLGKKTASIRRENFAKTLGWEFLTEEKCLRILWEVGKMTSIKKRLKT